MDTRKGQKCDSNPIRNQSLIIINIYCIPKGAHYLNYKVHAEEQMDAIYAARHDER